MKLETLAFQEILKHTPDIFEAVVVLGGRAEQITGRRAAERTIIEEDYSEEEYDSDELLEDPDYVEEEKEVVLAMDDFLGKRLNWKYSAIEGEDDTGNQKT